LGTARNIYGVKAENGFLYYPFGSSMVSFSNTEFHYSYAFNGMERDDEVKGNGNTLDFGARIYDSRLGRFLSKDPMNFKFPYSTPYSFSENTPIACIDLGGYEMFYAADGSFLGKFGKSNDIRVVDNVFLFLKNRDNLNYLIYNSKLLSESSIETQSNIYTSIFMKVIDELNKSKDEQYGLFKNKILIDAKGAENEKTDDGGDLYIALRASSPYAVSYYSLLSNKGFISVNTVVDNYYDILKVLEHENRHNLITKKRGKHASQHGSVHFDIEWGVYIKYKALASEDSNKYSKELLESYLDEMVRDLDVIEDKSSKKYRMKYDEYSKRLNLFEKEFSKYESTNN
jgi:RHS repeat-associated protein